MEEPLFALARGCGQQRAPDQRRLGRGENRCAHLFRIFNFFEELRVLLELRRAADATA
jgi:hypothetical protein